MNRFKETTAWAREARSTGEALAGVPGPFAGQQRSVLSELRLARVRRSSSPAKWREGATPEAAAEPSALLVEHPVRELRGGLLMTALYGAGRQCEPLTIYHMTSHLLRQRLGVSPSPELQQVHERILSGRFQLPQRADRPKGAPRTPPHHALA
ncbi:BTAD domain-containing putative transcriptional regulator [Streptomyces sp. NPDC007856]|uniref:AfsR/SARP family transcriptional regulator n=1 Tax=Streptomyces sp. NPDC007856 TaxID=3364781 RepID=UPI00368B1F82